MVLRFLLGIAAIAAAIWIVFYFVERDALQREMREPWPFGLGSIITDARPPERGTPEAMEVGAALRTLPDVGDHAWIAAQVRKKNDAIDALPAGVDAAKPRAAELVRLAVAYGDRIVWPDRQFVSFRIDQVADTLGVLALERARAGDGAAAWSDLQAMSILASSLRRQRTPFAKAKAIDVQRRVVAIARKLPPPSPPWLDELVIEDPRRETAEMLQTRMLYVLPRTRQASPAAVLAFLVKPLIDHHAARIIRETRSAALAMTARRCRIDQRTLDPSATQAAQDVYRTARIDAEREAAGKILALKSERARLGKWPPPSHAIAVSRCHGNVWNYEAAADGSMSLWMSSEPAWEPSATLVPQLDFKY